MQGRQPVLEFSHPVVDSAADLNDVVSPRVLVRQVVDSCVRPPDRLGHQIPHPFDPQQDESGYGEAARHHPDQIKIHV